MCWDRSRKILPPEVTRVFKKFLSEINKKTFLHIYFIGTDFCEDEREKYLELLQNHNLMCENFSAVSEKESDVMMVGFKSFMSNKKK